MSDIINFNGTIEGLGGPLIGWREYKKVIFKYYRKGTKYSAPGDIEVDNKGNEVQKYKEVTIENVEDIKEDTPISKIEVRYIRVKDVKNLQTDSNGKISFKKGSNDYSLNYIKWLPLGMANSLLGYTDDALNNITKGLWNALPISLRPIIVRDEQRTASSYVTQEKRTLDDNNDSMIKESAYYSISKKQDSLTITLFSVKSNLVLNLLLGQLDTIMNAQKAAQGLDGMVMDGSEITFPDYTGFPNDKNKWDKSNDKYFIERVYIKDSKPSYLVSYINDNIYFLDGKLTSYSTIPAPNGDGVTVNINIEKLVSGEQAWIYQKEKGNEKIQVESTTTNGDTHFTDNGNTTNSGGMCYINNSTTNGISNPLLQSIPLTGKGSTPPMTVWK